MKEKPESPAPPTAAPTADPFQVWREWLDRSERQWNEWLGEAMESEQFGRGGRRLLDLALGFQSSMNEATHRYFTTLNVPTRTDVLQLGERLVAIEERLGGIEAMLSERDHVPTAKAARAAAPRPKRTRKPPAKP